MSKLEYGLNLTKRHLRTELEWAPHIKISRYRVNLQPLKFYIAYRKFLLLFFSGRVCSRLNKQQSHNRQFL